MSDDAPARDPLAHFPFEAGIGGHAARKTAEMLAACWREAMTSEDPLALSQLTGDIDAAIEQLLRWKGHLEGDGCLHVNAYAVSRHYGGPEEGGWWYNAGEPVESVRVPDRETAERVCERLFERYAEVNRGDIYSCAPGRKEKLVVRIEDHQGRPWPQAATYC